MRADGYLRDQRTSGFFLCACGRSCIRIRRAASSCSFPIAYRIAAGAAEIASPAAWLRLRKLDDADAGDGFYLAKSLHRGVGDGRIRNVNLDYSKRLTLRNALRSCRRGRAPKGEVGDVNLLLAKNRSNAPDDAGDVVVADGDEGSVERSLDIDAVVGEQARRGAMQDRCRSAGVSIGGSEGRA